MKRFQAQHGSLFPDLPPAFDRRRRERIALKIPVRILTYGLLMEKADEGICTDLSESGLAFDCTAELNVGDVVALEFQQRGEATYRCHARLTYRLSQRYGAYFLGVE